MGRVKLHVKRIENNSGRQTTYCKRKNGLFKKAQELSILCDIDIVLLAFSPSGKPTLYTGENRSIEEIIEKFSQLPPWERAKRKLESLEALKKTYKKSDHDVNIQDFVGPGYKSVEDLTAEVNLLQTQIFEARKKLSYWSNLDKIDSTEHLEEMEISLHKSLHQIRTYKVNLERKQQMEIQSANQFKDEMHLSFSWALEERLQPFSWFPNDYNQHVISSDDLNLLTQRDSESSAGTSLGSYCGISDPSGKVDITKIGQENDIMNEFFGPTESSSLQLNENLQVYEQQIYPSYNFGVLCDKKFQPTEEMNVEENTLDYFIDRKFEVPFFGYDPTHRGWASTSATFSLAMFDELLYPQQHQ